jgi:hypothetical protein
MFMEQLFQWMASLTKAEAIGYASLVCFIMLFIPYASVAFKICKKIVLWQKLKVSHFGYTFYLDTIEELDNENDAVLKHESPDFVIEGSKIMLHWIVEGALWVKIYPGIGKVNGNAAELLIHRNRRHFILEARGIFSKKQLQLEIPLNKIKLLDVTELSEAKLITQVKQVKSFAFSDSVLLNNLFTKYIPSNFLLSKLRMHYTSSLIYKTSDDLVESKLNIKHRIELQKMVKKYNFSTQKYNEINKIKPINFKQL